MCSDMAFSETAQNEAPDLGPTGETEAFPPYLYMHRMGPEPQKRGRGRREGAERTSKRTYPYS